MFSSDYENTKVIQGHSSEIHAIRQERDPVITASSSTMHE